jgi:hypothetical protein
MKKLFLLTVLLYNGILLNAEPVNREYARQIAIKFYTHFAPANIDETRDSESNDNFIHKLKIAVKEANETNYWLQLCLKEKNYPSPEKLNDRLISIKKTAEQHNYRYEKQKKTKVILLIIS